MLGSRLVRAGVALLLCAAVLVVSACGCSKTASSGGGTAGQSQSATGTSDASPSASASDSDTPVPMDGGTPSVGARKKLSSSDAKAIDAELSAIERELDNLQLPSDSDFGGLESGLE